MTLAEHERDTVRPQPRPAFARPRLILYVLLGGALGTAARAAVTLAIPTADGIPWSTVIVNIVGAFLLGFLLTVLAAAGTETPARRDIRLFAGTGFMGGFTTYSDLATSAATLWETQPALAAGFAVLTVAVGILAAWGGILLAGRLFPARKADS